MATRAEKAPQPSSSGEASDVALASTIFARLHPATYLHRFLSSSLRPDGRSFDDVREARLGAATIQVAQGSCVVRLGNTMMIAGVRAELLDISDEDASDSEGSDDEDDEEAMQEATTSKAISAERRPRRRKIGLGPIDRRRIVVGVDLGPMASPRFKPGPPGQEAQLLASRLQQTLEICPPLDASTLVIEDRLMSWCLYVDIVCIAYDGNAFDAGLLAINGALQDTRLPQTVFDAQREQYISSPDAARASPLHLHACPTSLTFAIVDGGYLLADPNAFEATLAAGTINVTLDVTRLGRRRDLVDVHVVGRCEARISRAQAKQAGLKAGEYEAAEDSQDERVLVRDESLIRICIERARRQAAVSKEALLKAQRPKGDVDMA